jgi:hypothetical protein
MNMEMRHDIAEQQIVDMTGLENAFDGPSDVLNVRPVISELVWRKISEGRDMSAPKHDCHMAGSYCVPFKKSLADSAAVEGLAGQIGTKGTSDTPLARFPVLWPGSFHVIAPTLWNGLICPTHRKSAAGPVSAEARVGGLGTTARASGLYRLESIKRIAVVPPTIETADQLLHAKAELNHIQRTFRRAITTNPVTVRDDQSPPVEVSRRRSAHCSMGDIHSAGNVASPVDLRRSCVYKNNPVSSPKSLIQVPWVDFVLKLRLVISNLVVHRYLLSRSASVTRRKIT